MTVTDKQNGRRQRAIRNNGKLRGRFSLRPRTDVRYLNPTARIMGTPRVLIVGGQSSWVDGLRERIGQGRCEIISADSPDQAVQWAANLRCDLVVVAPEVTEEGTLELCRGLREQPSPAAPPLLLLSPKTPAGPPQSGGPKERAEAHLDDEIAGLIQRAAAAFDEPAAGPEADDVVALHGIEIDRACYRVTVDGREAKFTPTEFRILWTLINQAGFVFSRQQLLELCVGENAPSYARTIDVHIKAIRQKLAPRGDAIETVRGIGYRFRSQPEPKDRGQ